MKISIVIPISERPDKKEVLNRCLQSINRQIFKDYEIIMPENGKGWASNHNEGIVRAKGEFIKFLHMDDFFSDDRSLSNIVAKLKPDINWIVAGCGHTFNGDEWINPHYPKWNDKIALGDNTIGGPSVLTIRNDKPLLFNEDLSWLVDCEYYHRLYLRYGLPTILDQINVIIGLGPNQATNILSDELKANEHVYMENQYAKSTKN